MDEVNVAPLSAELDRLHAEHHRYAQRLEELLQKPYLSVDEQLEEVRLQETQAARQGSDLCTGAPRARNGVALSRD